MVKRFFIYFFIFLLLGIDIGILISFLGIKNELNFNNLFSQKTPVHTKSSSAPILINKIYQPPFYSVVIDNHWAARPQYNLDKAFLIYEVLVEGGITRFLVFYPIDINLKKIGPIRSARPYLIDLSKYTYFIHAGGSKRALDILDRINRTKIVNIDEISFLGDYFTRDHKRNPPHNLFISTKNLSDIRENYYKVDFSSYYKNIDWTFEKIKNIKEINNIEIDFSLEDYKVNWIFDKKDKSYKRIQGGKKFYTLDDNEKKIQVESPNIVIFYTTIKAADEKHLAISTLGKGDAMICIKGNCKEGRWERSQEDILPHFFDLKGNKIDFSKGPIWIEILQNKKNVKIYSSS